jgi:hypothetical protein
MVLTHKHTHAHTPFHYLPLLFSRIVATANTHTHTYTHKQLNKHTAEEALAGRGHSFTKLIRTWMWKNPSPYHPRERVPHQHSFHYYTILATALQSRVLLLLLLLRLFLLLLVLLAPLC